MSEPHLDWDDLRAGGRLLAEHRIQAREEYERHAKKVVLAEESYRVKKGREMAKFRAQERGVGESEILADAEAAGERAERDMEQVLAKVALMRWQEIERNQATFRQLGEWSKELETVG